MAATMPNSKQREKNPKKLLALYKKAFREAIHDEEKHALFGERFCPNM